MDFRVLTVNDTPHLCFSDDTFLTAVRDTGFHRAYPVMGTVVGRPFQKTTFAFFTAGSRLFDHQRTVLCQRCTLLLLTLRFLIQTDAGDAGVVCDVGDV